MGNSFKDIKAWQKAHDLVLKVYEIKYPATELYGLQSQIRRSVLSVPTNIAEGSGRGTKKEISQFLIISRGSLEETRYLIFLSKELKYINDAEFEVLRSLALDTSKLINGLIKSLKKR